VTHGPTRLFDGLTEVECYKIQVQKPKVVLSRPMR